MNNAPASCGAEGREVRRSNSPARTNSPLGCSARRGTAKQVPSGKLAADLSALGSSTAEVAQPCVPAIELREVSFSYGKEPFIGGLSAMFSHGAVTSIVGPNGCGKSTLLKALSRTMPLRGGAVYLDGRAIAEMPTAEVARRMALLPQSPQAPAGLTVGELVALGRYPHQKGFGRLTDDDKRIIDWALSITHLGDFAARPIDALSGGQRQRAWIAMALAQDTGLILLDEPTTYLDMAHQLEVLELLQTLNRDQGKTIALVIHELNLAARFSDWMIALKSGAIRGAGTPAEVMTPALLREVFGLDALIAPDPWTARPSLVSYRLAGEE